MALSITAVESTDLFVGSDDDPRQVVRVSLRGLRTDAIVTVTVTGGADGTLVTRWAGDPLDVPVHSTAAAPSTVDITVTADVSGAHAQRSAELVVAEVGWTMFMVSHFHYDPVWWNTQAAYTSEWDSLPIAAAVKDRWQHAAFDLVRAHLDLARRDHDYCFVLAEVDYLKPYWDLFPHDRVLIRELMAAGRLELVGGTYNEPNTNLTGAETTIRNAVYGIGFQRDILGGNPATAWQLDAFGHDPQFPGLMADAGLTSSSWARGPFHQWGPNMTVGAHGETQADPVGMQFGSEFEWISPSGRGLVTSYMPLHYSAGWRLDSASDLAAAQAATYTIFRQLASVATTRNVMVPVGGDYTPPAKWVTEVARDWNARYVWPKFRCAVPSDFFAAVAAELAHEQRSLSPQTRDMNPIYTGKDVSYIDTKLAQRATESLLVDAEKFAALASAHGLGAYPHAALDKAWRQLAYGAHHDGITGSESDQVYLDLLTSWREAWEIATEVHGRSTAAIAAAVDTRGDGRALTVFNPSSWDRGGMVSLTVDGPARRVLDDTGSPVECVIDRETGGSASLTFRATAIPSLGYRTYRLVPGEAQPATDTQQPPAWRPVVSTVIENEFYRLTIDPGRGGCVSSLVDLATGIEQVTDGMVGNEIVVYQEYSEHPVMHEGPWHLLPTGHSEGSAQAPAGVVVCERSALGERVTVKGVVGSVSYTQRLTLWRGERRLDCTTTVDTFSGENELIRLRWPCAVPGALPASEVSNAVIGRGFAHPDVDTALQPWTLDNPAYGWFGLTSTARVCLQDVDGQSVGERAIAIAEVVVPNAHDTNRLGRPLTVALVQSGVTATCSFGRGFRYGDIAFDSNLPDVRIAVGGPDVNSFTAQVLEQADSGYADELQRQLDLGGIAAVWVPASAPLTQAWVPGANLTGALQLPVLIVACAGDLAPATAFLVGELAMSKIPVSQPAHLCGQDMLQDRTVAILNRGLPGFAVDTAGRLHLSLMRSCTGWPSGVWIDPPRRFTPDGSGFQLQHWTHAFDYSLVAGAGDWRMNHLAEAAHDYNHPLTALVTEARNGPLAPGQSLLRVEPAGQVVLSTLKATGHPLAQGRAATGLGAGALTARVYEATGRETQVSVSSSLTIVSAVDADLLEVARDGAAPSAGGVTRSLGACDTATVLLTVEELRGGHEDRVLGPVREPVQPVYSRYWLHNRGPAPIGNQLVGVFAEPSIHGTIRVTVFSELTDAVAEGRLSVRLPDGWVADVDDRPVTLAPGGWTTADVQLKIPRAASKGPHPVIVQLEHGGQTYEDVVFVDGEGRGVLTTAAAGKVELALDHEAIVLRPGSRQRVVATLHNSAVFDVHGEAQLVGPWGTWEFSAHAAASFSIPANGRSAVSFDVSAPVDAPPGEWWFLIKTMYFGQVGYSASVPVRVEAAS